MSGHEVLGAKDSLDHAWNYFDLHAGQRMSMFNYFTAVTTALAGGIGYCVFTGGVANYVGIVGSVLLTIITLVFAKLDVRAKYFVKFAERAMSELESKLEPESARLVSNEAKGVARTIDGSAPPNSMWTYSCSFRVLFVAMWCGAGLATTFFVLRLIGVISTS